MTFGDSATASEDRRYVYDAAWNLNYRTNNTTLNTFKVDTRNQLTNATPVGNQTYDGNGNVTASGSVNYAYDDENRLIEHSASAKDVFIYDGLGRLRKRIEYVWTGFSWAENGTTYYIYDGMRVIQERTTAPTVSYTRGTDLSGSLEGAGGIGGLLARSHAYQTASGNFTNHNFYHADGNGNITYLVNSSQTVAASYRYDPYGNTISSSGSLASANVYRFSSKEIQVNSGLYYYGYRWYHPNLQRWLNRDPKREEGFRELRKTGLSGRMMKQDRSRRIGSKQNLDPLYVFAFNNAINRIDPKGLDSPGCDGFSNASMSACKLECCARHDKCFDDNDCSAWSWLNPLPCLTPCGRCNLEVVDCFLQCLDGYGDNPSQENYYCAQCHVYFDLDNPTDIDFPEDNPHFGHHTYGFPDP